MMDNMISHNPDAIDTDAAREMLGVPMVDGNAADKYEAFLKSKHARVEYAGFDVAADAINPAMFKFQRDIVRWALKLGRAAIFAERGLGKTFMEGEWARHVAAYTGRPVLIVAPKAVAITQTVPELARWGIETRYVTTQAEADGLMIAVTNYERVDAFDMSQFAGLVLDESSILKNFTGKTKRKLIEMGRPVPYLLAGSATPAPNDHMELGNHAEFLGVMPSNEMIARWFINDTMKAGNYRLKKHAESDFWRWLTSWAVCISHPRDLGPEYDMPEFDLPQLHIHDHLVATPQESIKRAQSDGRLMPDTRPSSTELFKVKRESLALRVERARQVVDSIPDDEPITIWCETNDEADALQAAFPDAVEVRGGQNKQDESLRSFSDGEKRIIITKPSIAGFGLNWQHCNRVLFVGATFSFERWYQAVGRSHRFGQKRPVHVHMVTAETEGAVIQTLNDKRKAFREMQSKMNEAMGEHGLFRDDDRRNLVTVDQDVASGSEWTLHLGDCVDMVRGVADNSIHHTIYSPPFANLYIYSDAAADMGNAKDTEEFIEHYRWLVRELYRVTMPGRQTAVHVKDLPLYRNSNGWHGVEPFSDLVIRAHLDAGWVYNGRVTIWKNPVDEMEKTKSHGLLHRNFAQRAQVLRTGLPDYLLLFAKPDPEGAGVDVIHRLPIGHYVGTDKPDMRGVHPRKAPKWWTGTDMQYEYSIRVWQKYASPVWWDIDIQNVLNKKLAKGNKDEKHIAPLQLDVIQRSIVLFTNPGELVLSPFAGIGSEGVGAIREGRQFIGAELKPEYWRIAIRHLEEAEVESKRVDLFSWADAQKEGAGDDIA